MNKTLLKAWERILKVRRQDRPPAISYREHLLDEFIECHGDRYTGDDQTISTCIGTIDQIPVTLITVDIDQESKDLFGRPQKMPQAEGYRKAVRMMKQAEKFNRPVICIIGNIETTCGIEVEKKGISLAIGEIMALMSSLKTPLVTIYVGEASGEAAIAFGHADRLWMMDNAVLSTMRPEDFAIHHYDDEDEEQTIKASERMRMTASELLEFGFIDSIINEPLDGAHESFNDMIEPLREKLVEAIKELNMIHLPDLLHHRQLRYKKF